MDYLRLIWIVDYSGPRGAAWPRVSISEPLAFTSTSSLFFCLCLVLDPRYQTSRRPPTLSLRHPPISSCFLPTLCALPTTHLAAPSRRSSSVPTWLGLRPITCLPVIRCCANPAFRVNSLCSPTSKTYAISSPILSP